MKALYTQTSIIGKFQKYFLKYFRKKANIQRFIRYVVIRVVCEWFPKCQLQF